MDSKIIVEQAIFQEAKIDRMDQNKAKFRMVLQTSDEKNQNKRIYPKNVLAEGMRNCESRMKRKALLGELDHPIPKGLTTDGMRQSTVLLKECSHVINNYEWNGNKLIGNLETLNTPNGKILLGLLKDKVGLGISMRGLAEVNRTEDANIVKGPLLIVAYDMVSNPSHQAAVVDFNECKFESSMLQESCNTVCTPDGNCYLADYFDKLIETKIFEIVERWI